MCTPTKIFFLAAFFGFAFAPVWLQGKTKTKKKHNKENITVGFQAGISRSFNATINQQGNNHRFFLRKTLNQHLKIETGLDYYMQQKQTINASVTNFSGYQTPYKMTVPASIEYYILPETCFLRPFCGIGLQYNNPKIVAPIGDINTYISNRQPGTRYVSILFTQGVTYEINTRIQVTQSFHFIQNNNEKVFGLDIGVGFKLP